jgi:HAD superfamily hydrolase (TIGR01459 family)
MTLQTAFHMSATSMASNVRHDSMTSPILPKIRQGLSAIANRYDTFLIDQWGVLHDGNKPYAGAVDCLRHLTAAGKKVIIISNSGKRSAENEKRLKSIGFPADSYSHLVTSGEIAWQMLATHRGPFRNLASKRCLILSSDNPAEFAQGLPIRVAETVEEADFILLAGIDDRISQQDYDHIIATGVRRRIPLICANPDLTRITADGLKPGAGAMASNYQLNGGNVSYIGKPYPEIYVHCLMLAESGPGSRVLAIGDSLHHDVAGGIAAGIDTLLILGGVHTEHFPENAELATLKDAMIRITGDDSTIPNWVIPSFKW